MQTLLCLLPAGPGKAVLAIPGAQKTAPNAHNLSFSKLMLWLLVQKLIDNK